MEEQRGGGGTSRKRYKTVRKVDKMRIDVKRDKCIPHDPTFLRGKQQECGWKWIDSSKQDERRNRVDFFQQLSFSFSYIGTRKINIKGKINTAKW
jgi:hypothetical protein